MTSSPVSGVSNPDPAVVMVLVTPPSGWEWWCGGALERVLRVIVVGLLDKVLGSSFREWKGWGGVWAGVGGRAAAGPWPRWRGREVSRVKALHLSPFLLFPPIPTHGHFDGLADPGFIAKPCGVCIVWVWCGQGQGMLGRSARGGACKRRRLAIACLFSSFSRAPSSSEAREGDALVGGSTVIWCSESACCC